MGYDMMRTPQGDIMCWETHLYVRVEGSFAKDVVLYLMEEGWRVTFASCCHES